jgi:hypothetical protein
MGQIKNSEINGKMKNGQLERVDHSPFLLKYFDGFALG